EYTTNMLLPSRASGHSSLVLETPKILYGYQTRHASCRLNHHFMVTQIGNMIPPDDTGADTFRRFRFQAEVAFPYCLNCAIGGSIKSIVMEHFEDIAIEEATRWRFQQIKTRNLDRGPWKLSDILKSGGGIDALFRTYQAVKDHGNIRLELLLEGALKRPDPIN